MTKSAGENDNASAGTRLTQQVEAAIADLAKRTGVAPAEIRVDQARMVSWGTSAMGCPRKGMDYMQVIVPGILVLLEANGRIYRYHGGMNTDPFYCPDDQAQAPALGQGSEFM